MISWVVTVPKTTAWSDYERELGAAAAGQNLNYRVRGFPKLMAIGDRCYIVHDGMVRGWMTIISLVDKKDAWRCSTTEGWWPSGKYIQRSGAFHATNGPPMTGFRGVRQFKL